MVSNHDVIWYRCRQRNDEQRKDSAPSIEAFGEFQKFQVRIAKNLLLKNAENDQHHHHHDHHHTTNNQNQQTNQQTNNQTVKKNKETNQQNKQTS